MVLIKEIVVDKIEIVGEFKHVQVRTATIIKENGKEISRSFQRHVVSPGMDTTKETADVKSICAAVHTQAIKNSYKAHIEEK